MATIRKNIIANFAGTVWSALMGFAFVPLYVKYLGMESYGLVGVFASLQTWLSLMDLGISPALSREMARFKAGGHTAQGIRELLRSVEAVYLGLALTATCAVWGAAPWLSRSWLRAENLSPATVGDALKVIGVVVALRWFVGPYRGALTGLQQQVWLNGSNIFFGTMRGAGVIAVLAWISPSIEAFFLFQGATACLETAALSWKLRRELPAARLSRSFMLNRLKEIRGYAGGVMTITILSLLLTQVDKIMLSKMLTLSEFGLYTVAGTVAGALLMLVSPVSTAVFPRLVELHTRQEGQEFLDTYHRFSQILATVMVPPAVTLIFFSKEVMVLWMKNPSTSAASAPIISLLVLGNMLNGFMYIPYMAQLAYGWTRFAVVMNSVALVVLAPAIYLGVGRYGAVGAGAVWVALNVGYIAIAIQFMHRHILIGEKRRWYLHSVLAPLSAACAAVGIVRLVATCEGAPRWQLVAWVALAASASVGATAFATPIGREMVQRGKIALASFPALRRLLSHG